jgi:hypothetical protein
VRVAAVAALILLLATPSATAESASTQSNVLTALADVGTVYWRFDCTRGEPQRWSLGLRLYDTATTTVIFRSGRRTVRRTMQPGGRRWFRLTTARRQRLEFAQYTEPGELRGSVSVNFGQGPVDHCESYFPPRFTTQLHPR